MNQIVFFALLQLLLHIPSSVDGLQCVSCQDVVDEAMCTANRTCTQGQSCYKMTHEVNNAIVITEGCLDNKQCGVDVSTIIGRDTSVIGRRQSNICRECCATDNCNADLCRHQKPSVCVDDETIDCPKMNSVFNICNDIQNAKNFCPNFCGLCNVVDGQWSTWSDWNQCVVTCDNGTVSRQRTCSNPAPSGGGLNCTGQSNQIKQCFTATPCPVDGNWSDWGLWGSCSVSCETGIQTRSRTCTNPMPNYFGNQCSGTNNEAKLCDNGPCADGGWSSWSTWSACTSKCGIGVKTQSRSCTNPVPSPHGHYCVGNTIRVGICTDYTVCNDGQWNSWSDWTRCAVTCDKGTVSRQRTCANNSPLTVGLNCTGETSEVRECISAKACPVGIYEDCFDIKEHTPNANDGIYTVKLWKTKRSIHVYCDMSMNGGGWTVFQNRFDGHVDFYRNFAEYEKGFGNLNSEFWLGLGYIYEMASHYKNQLRIDLTASNGTTAFEVFDDFSLSPGPTYRLHVGNTSSSHNINVSSSLRFSPTHNGMAFTTFDHDVDTNKDYNCASYNSGAWWYRQCFTANLNGQYLTPGISANKGINYLSFIYFSSLKQTKISFRRSQT